MTKKLEELLDLPAKEKEKKISTEIITPKEVEDLPEKKLRTIEESDKISAALPQVKGLGDLSDSEFDIMINVALGLEPLWENAIGKQWKKTITKDKLKGLYQKM